MRSFILLSVFSLMFIMDGLFAAEFTKHYFRGRDSKRSENSENAAKRDFAGEVVEGEINQQVIDSRIPGFSSLGGLNDVNFGLFDIDSDRKNKVNRRNTPLRQGFGDIFDEIDPFEIPYIDVFVIVELHFEGVPENPDVEEYTVTCEGALVSSKWLVMCGHCLTDVYVDDYDTAHVNWAYAAEVHLHFYDPLIEDEHLEADCYYLFSPDIAMIAVVGEGFLTPQNYTSYCLDGYINPARELLTYNGLVDFSDIDEIDIIRRERPTASKEGRSIYDDHPYEDAYILQTDTITLSDGTTSIFFDTLPYSLGTSRFIEWPSEEKFYDMSNILKQCVGTQWYIQGVLSTSSESRSRTMVRSDLFVRIAQAEPLIREYAELDDHNLECGFLSNLPADKINLAINFKK